MRILTRIFLWFWLVIVLIAASAVALTVLNFATDHRNPDVVTRQAAEILQSDGVEGLRRWLARRNARFAAQRTLIIDERGAELLGQRLPGLRRPGMHTPELHEHSPTHAIPARRLHQLHARGRQLQASDGSRYWLLFDPPPRRGPFSPPFSWSVRLGLLGLAIALSGAMSYLLARTISRPLEQLQATARALSTGNLAVRTHAKVAARRDEVGVLARELDDMAARLDALISARQQLLRDISHELRSPLARLQMAVGLGKQDMARAADQLGRIEREAENLEALIASILEYSRLERDPATLQLEEVDLGELLRQILHDARFESQAPPDRLRLERCDDVTLRGDATVLHAALDNVVRNALRHGGPDPLIEVRLTVDAHAVSIEVRDHGPGVPEEELEQIFVPFYRAAGPRPASSSAKVSQGPYSAGSGLGLAITARAATLHRGRVTARNAPDGGLIVTVVLPRNAL